ncbi:MAG: hypothetical protein V1844_05110 [Pseudomonadota bacterium]
MGKTNTTKASKKKTVSKKKETEKKVKADPAAPEHKSDQKAEETRTTVELKGPKNAKKSVEAEIPIQKKPVLLSDLILKKFDAWQPDNLFVQIPDELIFPDAPPFVSDTDDKEFNRKRALLFTAFDMKAIIAEGERFAAEKAEAERIAAEKAAAEKAEAERIAAEKAAAEKAEAERIAAEKAAAEKAEAERIAAEKAAAEKAEAERIAAEKAAAEKAEAERIAAEKAAAAEQRKKAAELQKASEPKVKITYDQPVKPIKPEKPAKDADPMDKTIIIAAGCFALLVLILIGTSLCNAQKYYIKTAKNGIEIWQGKFSPKGEKQLISLTGIKAPAKVQKVYAQIDVYPIIFSYFLNKADAVLDAPGIPDFEGMKYFIGLAEPYAITKELREAADLRLNSMAQTLLIYKADIAASRGNLADLEAAVGFLNKAKSTNSDKAQAESLDKKINAATWKLEQLKAQPKVAATAKP